MIDNNGPIQWKLIDNLEKERKGRRGGGGGGEKIEKSKSKQVIIFFFFIDFVEFKQRESVMLSSYLYILYALPRWWPVYRTSENIVKTINLKRQETTSHDYQSQSFFIQFYIGGGESV